MTTATRSTYADAIRTRYDLRAAAHWTVALVLPGGPVADALRGAYDWPRAVRAEERRTAGPALLAWRRLFGALAALDDYIDSGDLDGARTEVRRIVDEIAPWLS